RRRDQYHAEVRGILGAVRLRQFGRAGHLGIHRRIHGDPGVVQGQPLVCVPGRDHPDIGRGVHPVAHQTRRLWRDRQRQGGGAQGPQRPRIPGARRACRRGSGAGPVARAAVGCDACIHPTFGPAAAGLEDPSLRLKAMHSLAQFSVSEFNSGLIYACPEIFLALGACAILMLDLLLNDAQRRWTGALSVIVLLITALLVALHPISERIVALGGLFELDRMAQVLKVFILLIVAAVFVYSTDYLQRRSILKGEYYVLGLFATLGAMVLTSAGSLITLYLGLELMSLCLYAMVAFDRESGVAAESAIKYFVLGSMTSGTLLYGMSIIYGVTGSLEIAAIADAVRNGLGGNIGLVFGIAFLIVGIGFKFGAVPFHMWIPDVYEGSPTCVAVFITTASKLAAFGL